MKIDFKFKKKGFKKLLLFDLDETLIHIWGRDPTQEEGFHPDIQIPILDPETNEIEYFGLSIRPYVRDCLKYANKHYEVGIFTASHKWFAEQILDFLDPDKTLIQHRFYRQHTCKLEDNDDYLFVKDLNMFKGEVSLKDILLIDNNIYSFGFQLENGIPILDFLGDKNDTELLKVMHTLCHLKNFDDLRIENEKIFRLRDIYNQDMDLYIKYYDSD